MFYDIKTLYSKSRGQELINILKLDCFVYRGHGGDWWLKGNNQNFFDLDKLVSTGTLDEFTVGVYCEHVL